MNFYGTFDPNQGFLPELNTQYTTGAWLITGTAAIGETLYNEKEWLVAIREGEKINYAVASTVVNFLDPSNSMTTEPGFFTKVRLGSVGNVLSGEYLTQEDLPTHSHKAQDVSELKEALLEVFKTLFGDSDKTAVDFIWNEETQTFTADVKIDELSINKNEFGQLVSTGGSSSGGNATIDWNQINTAIDQALETYDFQKSLIFSSNGFKDETIDGARRIELKLDESLITFNADRELTLNQTFLENIQGLDEHFGNQCTVEVSLEDLVEIEGLKEWILEQVQDVFKFDIKDYIDESTIILNADGKISAVAMKVQPHTHEIEQIEGLKEKLIWAVNQNLNLDESNLNFQDGSLNLTNKTIGETIVLINNYLKYYTDQIEELKILVGNAKPTEPTYNAGKTLELKGSLGEIECYHLTNPDLLECSKIKCQNGEISLEISKLYPIKGNLEVYVNDELVSSTENLEKIFENDVVDYLECTKIYDYYSDLEQFIGWYNAADYSIKIPSIIEQPNAKITVKHTTFTNNIPSHIYHSYVGSIYKEAVPTLKLIIDQPNLNTRVVSGIPCTIENKMTLQPLVENAFTECFLPVEVSLNFSFLDKDCSTSIKEIDLINKRVFFKETHFELDENFYNKSIQVYYTTLFSTFTENFSINDFNYNTTAAEIEGYRVIYPVADYTDFQSYKDFNNTEDLSKTFESVLINGCMINTPFNYEEIGGYDYSNLISASDKGYRYCSLKFDVETQILPQAISFELIDAKGSIFEKTKYGTFKDFKCQIGLFKDDILRATLQANTPYEFEGSVDFTDTNFNSLDLYSTTDKKVSLTLGINPKLKDVNKVILFIGCNAEKSLDIQNVINTFSIK